MSTYAYVNPLVAIVLGSVLLSEPIDVFIVIGAAMIVTAVVVVVRSEATHAPVLPAPDIGSGSAEVGEIAPAD